jgi:CelD/BcsL family acetyltransferase involved in cellulose biosynthesis
MRGPDGPIAAGITLHLGSVAYAYRQAFDPNYAALAPGLVLRFDTIRRAAGDEGCLTFDLSDGEARWNTEIGEESGRLYEGIGLSRSARGAIAAPLHRVARRAVDARRRRSAARQG